VGFRSRFGLGALTGIVLFALSKGERSFLADSRAPADGIARMQRDVMPQTSE
jgi:hypothetical protein